MNKFALILFVLTSTISMCSCQPKNCEIYGNWNIKSGRIFENYESAHPYSSNRITFFKDSVELASGFFYNTQGLDDEYPIGRYPFVYYGNKEKFRVSGDSLLIYSSPYKSWNSFRIVCLKSGELKLIGKMDTLLLSKSGITDKAENCSLKYVKAHVDGGDLSVNRINYRVTYSDDDKLTYEEWDFQNKEFKTEELKLKANTFREICLRLNSVDLLNLNKLYTTDISDFTTLNVEIGLTDGKTIKFEIRGEDSPDELRIALIPVLYGHQRLLYGELPAKRWNE